MSVVHAVVLGDPRTPLSSASQWRETAKGGRIGTTETLTGMPTCDTCGNSYDKTFAVTYEGKKYQFDSFECAIHKLAPQCQHCGCRVIGHGVEDHGTYFCCVHCASQAGVAGLKDRL